MNPDREGKSSKRLLGWWAIGSCVLLLLAAPAGAVTFTTNTLIDCGDTTYDGQAIVVQGCTVTINGPHTFASLSVQRNASNQAGLVTHDASAVCFGTALVNGMDLTITGNVTIQGASGNLPASAIDVSGKGRIHSAGTGQGQDGTYAGGGGYGGAGGCGYNNGTQGGGTYGLPTVLQSCLQPTDLGSGGGDSPANGYAGGAGGGAIRLTINGALTVNGSIMANGQAASDSNYSGGGSGGSLWISASALTGTGSITANGGASGGNRYTGGGGGGRIAVYTDNMLMDNGQIKAWGGAGWQPGGAGTVYIETPRGSMGVLIVNNGGTAGATTEFSGEQAFPPMDVVVSGQGIIGPPMQDATLHLTFNGNVTINSDGWISASKRGWWHSHGPGKGQDGTYAAGGGYGGAGGNGYSNGTRGGGTYGSPTVLQSCTQPIDFGSGGGDSPANGFVGGAGGGAFRLTVNGTLTVNGIISADGQAATDSNYSGGGSGGSLWISTNLLTGTGSITANGGATGGNRNTGGGGGGRVAVYADTMLMDNSQIKAWGGAGWQPGGAGTVYIETPRGSKGTLIVDNGGTAGATTEFSGEQVFPPMDLMVSRQGIVGPPRQDASLHLTFNGNVTVKNDGFISASGRGYTHSDGPGQGQDGTYAAGGGYGGVGGNGYNNAALGGGTYGNLMTPTDFGSGGGDSPANGVVGGAGGGVLRLTVNGTLNVLGIISANGQAAPDANYSGGGSGGSLWISTSALTGTGLITANGGASGGNKNTGGGGGGRIAIYACQLLMNPTYIRVDGGTGWDTGDPGTIYFAQPAVVSAASIKTHGASGEYGIPFNGYTWTGNPGGSASLSVECRRGGVNLARIKFDRNIAASHAELVAGGEVAATLTNASGPVALGTVSATISGDTVIVTIPEMTAPAAYVASCLKISLSGIYPAGGDPCYVMTPACVNIKIVRGDINGDGKVLSGDITLAKAGFTNSNINYDANMFRRDVVSDGNMYSGDVTLTKASGGDASALSCSCP